MSEQPVGEEIGGNPDGRRIILDPSHDEGALTNLLRHRRSTTSYRADHIGLQTVSRLLRTAVGFAPAAQRPYGSAHARYDVAVTVVAAAVQGLATAAYRYLRTEHALVLSEPGDHRSHLVCGTLDADWLTECPVVLLLSAHLGAANDAFEAQSKGRGERFCWLEAGLIAQNIYLWTAENELGTVFLGGLDSIKTQAATQRLIPPSHTVLGMLPIGRPKHPHRNCHTQ